MTYPRSRRLSILNAYNLVTFNEVDLRQSEQLLDDGRREAARIAIELFVDVSDGKAVVGKRGGLVCHLKEVEVVLHDRWMRILLQHHDVRVVDSAISVALNERGKSQRSPPWRRVERTGGQWCARHRGGEGESKGKDGCHGG